MATIGELIYEARRRNGWTQKVLADKIGTQSARISFWENDHDKPKENWLGRLEEALDCSLQEQDIAQQIRDYLDNSPATVREIAELAGLNSVTICNVRDRKRSPHKLTTEKIQQALEKLREKYPDDGSEWSDEEYLDEEDDEDVSERPKFIVEGNLGDNDSRGRMIKGYRLFDPRDEEHVEHLPETPGIYLLYAGNDDIAIPVKALLGDDIGASLSILKKIIIAGTPEYIGETINIRKRIIQHRKDKWWFQEEWINFAIYVETDEDLRKELETLLIKLFSPQINDKKQGIKISRD